MSWLRLCQANGLVTQDTWRSQRSEPPIRWYLRCFFQGLWQHRQTAHVSYSPLLWGPRQCKEISVSILWYQVSSSCWRWNVRRKKGSCKETPELPSYLSLFSTGCSTNGTKTNRLHPLKKPKVNWTCSARWPRKLVYTLSLERPNLLFVIFHTRVFSSKEKISRMSKILVSQYVYCVEPERRQVPERKSIECVLEIGSCLEVSFIILTKGSTFQSVSFNCPFWGWVLVLTSDLCCQLDSFQTSCLRIILGVSRTDHVSNEEVYDTTGTVPLSQSVKAWQIRFLGHCLQRPQEDLISNYALYHPTHGKPRPGGHKILFNEYAAKLINPENPPCSRNSYFGTGPQSLEAHGGRLLASLGTPMTASAELREVLQDWNWDKPVLAFLPGDLSTS